MAELIQELRPAAGRSRGQRCTAARGRAVKNRTGRGSVEGLENRLMLAAATPTVAADEVLQITGTAVGDRITVARVVGKGADEIRVTINGKRTFFSSAAVASIRIDAAEGDDLVQTGGNAKFTLPVRV